MVINRSDNLEKSIKVFILDFWIRFFVKAECMMMSGNNIGILMDSIVKKLPAFAESFLIFISM